MRLRWSERAIADLERIADRAPRTAERIIDAIEWLADSPFPAMFRHSEGRSTEHVLTVAPCIVVYRVEGDCLVVGAVEDARRRPNGW